LKLLILHIFLAVFIGIAGLSDLLAQPYTEYELKSAYLFNFGKFVTWPEESFVKTDNCFVIGIYGKNPFGDILKETVKNKTIQNRIVKVVFFENEEQVKNCQILFLSEVNPADAKKIFALLNGSSVLTVGDQIEDFCQNGGVINFTPQNYRFRFEINNVIAIKERIVISSKLLALAKIITEDEIRF
jgi:hypothetical protein